MGARTGAGSRSRRRRAVVTGASSGIGQAFAERLAREGWDLAIVARRRERLDALARRLERDYGVGVQVVASDLTDREALGELEERIESDSDLDLVVNNAGVAEFGHFIERDRDLEEKQIQLDVVALVRLTHAAVPAMVKRGHGAVINVSSVAGLTPGPCWAVYSAGKSFVNTFTQALRLEIQGTGVRLQALCPGLTQTELFDEAGADASSLPGFLWMRPEDVVDASIEALERDTVICVPGIGYQAFTTLGAWLPATLSGRIASFVNERAIKVPTKGRGEVTDLRSDHSNRAKSAEPGDAT